MADKKVWRSAVVLTAVIGTLCQAAERVPKDGKQLGTIFNNDGNNILYAFSGAEITVEEYKRAVRRLLEAQPGVLAQHVGQPDPVIYRTKVATSIDKHGTGRDSQAMGKLLKLGTDPLTLTIEVCREQGVPIVASYRMNGEDAEAEELNMYDFGRAHKDWAIPGRNCLDPAIPEVYQHRMAIFAEVANDYDIDGIEFDFMRWYYMISEPLKNYPILTQMVRDTRKLLDEAAKKKGRKKLLLGVRVGPMLEGKFIKAEFAGAYYGPPTNQSCRDLGLDVKTWIKEGLVDYVCPTLFWPRWPGLPRTFEFVELAKDTQVGIYPTVFPLPAWLETKPVNPIAADDYKRRARYRKELGQLALKCYEDGADGISTFNWYFHLWWADVPHLWTEDYGYGYGGAAEQLAIYPKFNSEAALKEYLSVNVPLSR